MTVPLIVAELTADILRRAEPEPEEAAPTQPVETLDNVLAGLRVDDLTEAVRRKYKLPAQSTGVVVTAVEEGSVAQTADVRVGDLIEQLRIEGQYTGIRLSDVKSYFAIGRKIKKDQGVLLLLRRGRTTVFVALDPES